MGLGRGQVLQPRLDETLLGSRCSISYQTPGTRQLPSNGVVTGPLILFIMNSHSYIYIFPSLSSKLDTHKFQSRSFVLRDSYIYMFPSLSSKIETHKFQSQSSVLRERSITFRVCQSVQCGANTEANTYSSQRTNKEQIGLKKIV